MQRERMTRVIQLRNGSIRRVAVVEEPELRLLDGVESVYALAREAIASGEPLSALIRARATGERLAYQPVYEGATEWHILPAIDQPEEPARCLVTGTGLTHLGSAADRQAMHHTPSEELTDSMKMFRWGVEGGRPDPDCIGVAPEWFYKGNASVLRAHGEPLSVPGYAEDGGEEAEIAGIYLIGPDGNPYRIGMATGNEFSDHRFEKRNYLNLAGSKLRTCSIGPELVIDPDFSSVPGRVAIERGADVLWEKAIRTGEEEMCHSLRNIEHHHFKFEAHRRPGDLHVHYFGAHSLSFGEGIALADGDVMVVQFENFGRALRNPVRVASSTAAPVLVQPLQ
jgi:hypothetical protein